MNAPTFTLIDLVFFLRPVPPSLSVITEQERGLCERGPNYDDGWFGELAKILQIVMSLHNYVEDWVTNAKPAVEEYTSLLRVYVLRGQFPAFTRFILELGVMESDPCTCWVFERTFAYHNDWEAKRNYTGHLNIAEREPDMYLRP